jgi:hypothetical protein
MSPSLISMFAAAQMVGSYFEVHWKYIHALESRNVKQHAATHDRRHRTKPPMVRIFVAQQNQCLRTCYLVGHRM